MQMLLRYLSTPRTRAQTHPVSTYRLKYTGQAPVHQGFSSKDRDYLEQLKKEKGGAMYVVLLLRDPVPTSPCSSSLQPPHTRGKKKRKRTSPQESPLILLCSHSHASLLAPRSPHLPTPNLSSTPDIPYLLCLFPPMPLQPSMPYMPSLISDACRLTI